MPSLSRPRLAAVAVASLGLATTAPAALATQAASAAPAPATADRDLLGSLLPTQLSSLVGSLTSNVAPGALPQATDLTALTAILGSLGTAGLPADQAAKVADAKALLAQLTAMTGGGIPTTLLDGLASKLSGVTGTDGLVATIRSLADGAKAGSPAAGLPIPNLSLDPSTLTALAGLAATPSLPSPTAASLAPVVTLLNTVGGQVPDPAGALIRQLATQVAQSNGVVPTALVSQVAQVLGSIANTPGVKGTPAADTLNTLAGTLGATAGGTGGGAATTPGGSSAPAAKGTATTVKTPTTAAARKGTPQVTSVRFNRRTGRLSATVACVAGNGNCAMLVYALTGTRLIGAPQTLALPEGRSATRTFKLDAKTRRALKKRSVRVSIGAVTSSTSKSAKGITLKKTAAKKHKK